MTGSDVQRRQLRGRADHSWVSTVLGRMHEVGHGGAEATAAKQSRGTRGSLGHTVKNSCYAAAWMTGTSIVGYIMA
jgi:hypothetical protein